MACLSPLKCGNQEYSILVTAGARIWEVYTKRGFFNRHGRLGKFPEPSRGSNLDQSYTLYGYSYPVLPGKKERKEKAVVCRLRLYVWYIVELDYTHRPKNRQWTLSIIITTPERSTDLMIPMGESSDPVRRSFRFIAPISG